MCESPYIQMEEYAVPLVEVVEEAVEKFGVSTNSVINFGCATGLTSFLLSANFEKVWYLPLFQSVA